MKILRTNYKIFQKWSNLDFGFSLLFYLDSIKLVELQYLLDERLNHYVELEF